MSVNDNTILYSLSRLIRDQFAAVASKYGTLSLAQSVSNIKQVVWNSFLLQTFVFNFCIVFYHHWRNNKWWWWWWYHALHCL